MNQTKAKRTFHLSVADQLPEPQNPQNKKYPTVITITSAQDLDLAARYDHCAGEFHENERSTANFRQTDCIMMDVDNDDTEDSSAWKTVEDVRAAFQGVLLYATFSRNHMKEKRGKPPRPKFHLYFPLAKDITDGQKVRQMKEAMLCIFSSFDPNAKDCARFFFGVVAPRAEFHDGAVCIDEWLEQHQELLPQPEMPKSQPPRSQTYSYDSDWEKVCLLDALDHIPVNDMEDAEWYAIGCALHYEGLQCSDWEYWSSKDTRISPKDGKPRYRPGECGRRWAKMNDNVPRPKTGGYIRKIASEQYGWTAPPRPRPERPPHTDAEAPPERGIEMPATTPTTEYQWGQVQAFGSDQAELPLFPTNVLTPVLRDYVVALAEATQTPPEMAGACVLGVLSTIYQRRYSMEVLPDWPEELCLFIGIVAPPGDRKTNVQSSSKEPIKNFEADWERENRVAIAQSRSRHRRLEATLAKAEAKAVSDKLTDTARHDAQGEADACASDLANHEVLVPRRYLIGDVTPEALTQVMAEQGGCISLWGDEPGVFSQMAGRYSKNATSNLDVYLSGYSGSDISIDRIGRDAVLIPRARLTMIVNMQPVTLRKLMGSDEMRGRGLVDRFWLVDCHPNTKVGERPSNPEAIPCQVKQEYNSFVWKELRGEGCGTLTFDQSGYDARTDYQNRVEKRLKAGARWGDTMQGWGNKQVGRACRVAGLLHCAEHHEPEKVGIDGDTFRRAEQIAEFFAAHCERIYEAGGETETSEAEYVKDRLMKAKNQTVSKHEIFQRCRGRFSSAADLYEPLDELVDRNMIRRVEVPRGRGNAKELYELNPAVFGKKSATG